MFSYNLHKIKTKQISSKINSNQTCFLKIYTLMYKNVNELNLMKLNELNVMICIVE